MQITYRGPFDAVQIQVGTAWVVIPKGEPTEVPDEIAGRAPTPEYSAAVAARDDIAVRRNAGEPGLDQAFMDASTAVLEATGENGEGPGAGLLAQVDNWTGPAPTTPPAAQRAKKNEGADQ